LFQNSTRFETKFETKFIVSLELLGSGFRVDAREIVDGFGHDFGEGLVPAGSQSRGGGLFQGDALGVGFLEQKFLLPGFRVEEEHSDSEDGSGLTGSAEIAVEFMGVEFKNGIWHEFAAGFGDVLEHAGAAEVATNGDGDGPAGENHKFGIGVEVIAVRSSAINERATFEERADLHIADGEDALGGGVGAFFGG
jgi:hypothetical protein